LFEDDWASEEEVQRAKQWMLALQAPSSEGFAANSDPEVSKIFSERDSFAVPGTQTHHIYLFPFAYN